MKTSQAVTLTCTAIALALLAHGLRPQDRQEPPTETASEVESEIEAGLEAEPEPEIEAASIMKPADPLLDRMEQQLAEDPIAQQVPMLSYAGKEMQLETLRWLQHVPEDKVVAAIPSLLAERHLPMELREEMARAMVGDMIRDLEDQGVFAPRAQAGAPVARLLSSVREPFLAPLGGGSDRGPASE